MLAEIEGVKADNSLIEEDIIKLMDEIELAKKKISEEKEIFKTEEANAQREKEIVNLKFQNQNLLYHKNLKLLQL